MDLQEQRRKVDGKKDAVHKTTARSEDLAVGHAPYLHASEKVCTNVFVIRYMFWLMDHRLR